MSNEQEAPESRLLASTPEQELALMGDVLAKEQRKDELPQIVSEEFEPPPLPALSDLDEEEERQDDDDDDDDEEDDEEETRQLDLDDSPSPEPASLSDENVEVSEELEDRLSGDSVANGENTIQNVEDTAPMENNQQCHATDTATDDLCNCEVCKGKKRDLSTADLQEMMKLRRLGMDLRQYIRYTFNWFIETSGFSINSSSPLPHQPQFADCIENFAELKESVVILCDRVPYHLFVWLLGQAQEFVIGVKVQLLTLLYDRSIDNLAEVFLTKLLDGYEALLATAVHISDLLEPLQKELFSKVNLTWGYINKSLYQNYVYSDPLIQNNLPPFLGQLRKHLQLKGSEYHYLVQRYLAFDDDITKIGSLCPEIERLIDKYNAEQVTGSIMKKVREDFERFKTRMIFGQPIVDVELNNKGDSGQETGDNSNNVVQNEEVANQNSDSQSCSLPNAVEIQSMFNDWKRSPQQRLADLVEALTLSSAMEEEKKSRISKEKKCYPSCLEKTVKEDINKSVSCEEQTCNCYFKNSIVDSPSSPVEENSQILQNSALNNCTVDSDNLKEDVASTGNDNVYSNALSRCVLTMSTNECGSEPANKVSKTSTAQTAQTQTRHSTTQTPSTTHNQGHVHRHHHQGRCSPQSQLRRSLFSAAIQFAPHRLSAAASCHKEQHIVEQIKRLATNDLSPGENGDCSDSGSSHEDSCSTTNSPTPRDSNRHCDCCYCEVFGHGVPSVAPVSRNYNEMRERLRQLLSKKKAKVCKAACNPHTKNSVEVSSSSSSLSSSSSTSSTITNVDSALTVPLPASRSNTPVSTNTAPVVGNKTVNASNLAAPPAVPKAKPKEELWNIEAAVEYIEGNQTGKKDKKKAEKKARQKQKKLDEKLKKEKEEEEKLKLLELQKKTPEVTITVVNPQKQVSSQKMVPQQKLPEVSILPTVMSTSQSGSKLGNASKKKNNELPNVNIKNTNKVKVVSSSGTTTSAENVKKKTASVEKINETISLNNAKSKTLVKTNEVVPQTAVNDNSSNLSNLTKKERKKLRREMEKQEALKRELESKQASGSSSESQSQIVTIKRIMESNNAEPTVTITLKGQTPAEDRVLFTLVNGQTKDSAGDKEPQTTGKKKKKGNNNQQQQTQNANNKSQKSNNSNNNNSNSKAEQSQKQDGKNTKQQSNKDKSKNAKQQEDVKLHQTQNVSTVETKSTKSKKDKKKNSENKENIMKHVTNENLQKQDVNTNNKKSNKTGDTQSTTQKQQQHQQQVNSNSNNKNSKTNKQTTQNQNQNQNNQNQKKNNNNNLMNSGKGGKNNTNSNTNSNSNQNVTLSKIDNQKGSKVAQNLSNKQKVNTEATLNHKREQMDSSLNNHYKEMNNASSSINIENLKLPPGITITKVDAPTKPLPLKSASAPKPVNNSPKQTTIIAAPMSGVPSSNYGNGQGTGNLIVVDTGRLKQDLIPKNMDKDSSKDLNNQSSTSKKKKKKKNKNVSVANGNEKVNGNIHPSQNKMQQQPHGNDYMNVEPARILHNPSTNMVTIRNPAFGPPPPKMEPTTQQAAIIKVAENGMVTIRSPALQLAINAGLQPPPKPDFIVKGSPNTTDSIKPNNNSFMNSGELSGSMKGSNGMQLSTNLAELRRRLTQQSENERTSSSTIFNNGLPSIQISKVTNGQSPNIPENGINLKGTSVTLTKIRNTEHQHINQPQPPQHFEEPKGNALNVNTNVKSRKKKKRGNGVRQYGDDWNLVESVFTPKDIDLEDGEMDDAERELEAFKRFCLQSVPPPRKEKVNLNIKDIVLKKKSSSTPAAASVVAAI